MYSRLFDLTKIRKVLTVAGVGYSAPIFHSESEIGEEFSDSLTSRSVSDDVRRGSHDQAADINLAVNFSRKLFENDCPGAFWTTSGMGPTEYSGASHIIVRGECWESAGRVPGESLKNFLFRMCL